MKLTITTLLLCFLCSCSDTRDIQKCKRTDIIYNYLISREINNPKGIDLSKIDSLDKERERKIKLYSKTN